MWGMSQTTTTFVLGLGLVALWLACGVTAMPLPDAWKDLTPDEQVTKALAALERCTTHASTLTSEHSAVLLRLKELESALMTLKRDNDELRRVNFFQITGLHGSPFHRLLQGFAQLGNALFRPFAPVVDVVSSTYTPFRARLQRDTAHLLTTFEDQYAYLREWLRPRFGLHAEAMAALLVMVFMFTVFLPPLYYFWYRVMTMGEAYTREEVHEKLMEIARGELNQRKKPTASSTTTSSRTQPSRRSRRTVEDLGEWRN